MCVCVCVCVCVSLFVCVTMITHHGGQITLLTRQGCEEAYSCYGEGTYFMRLEYGIGESVASFSGARLFL